MAGQSWTKSLNKIPFGPVLELWWWRAGRSRAAAIFGAIMIQLRPGSSSSLWWVAAVIRGDSTNRNTGGHIRRNIQVTTKPGAGDRLASEISIVDMVTLVHTSYHHTAGVQVLQCEYDCVRQPRLLHARLPSQQPPLPGAAADQNYHKLIAECFN